MLPEVGSTIVPPGLQLPLALGGLDHRHPDPVLVRAAGVQVLELREQRRRDVAADPVEPDDRRAADEVEQRWVLAGHRGASLRNRQAAAGHRRRLDDRRRRLPVDQEAVDHLLQVLDVPHVQLEEEAVLAGDPVALDHLRLSRASSATLGSWRADGRTRMIALSVYPSAFGSSSAR